MLQVIINIKSLFNNTLDSRDEAVRLFSTINPHYIPDTEIVLDFAEIEFMSRSFADQFHKERKVFMNKSKLPISITNASAQIIEILQAVSKTQNMKDRVFSELPSYSFSDEDQLLQYLEAI